MTGTLTNALARIAREPVAALPRVEVAGRWRGHQAAGEVHAQTELHTADWSSVEGHSAGALAPRRERYDQVAHGMGCFHASQLAALRMKPINQLWRDHMLAGSMILADGWKEGMFVVLYPVENIHVAEAVRKYEACLADSSTFGSWTLEAFVLALEAEGAGSWVDELRGRYLG